MTTIVSGLDWKDIHGWLEPHEGEALQELARGKRVLELGSFKGRSTVCMAGVAEMVVAVDHHQGDAGTGPADTLDTFRRNLQAAGANGRVASLVGTFDEAVAWWLETHPERFDLVFLDGSHTIPETTHEFQLAKSIVKPGGVIAAHDWNYAAVQSAAHLNGLGTPSGVVGVLAWWQL